MIFAVSALFLYLCGLGLLVTLCGTLPLGRQTATGERFPALAALVLVSGLHFDYLLQLLLKGVDPALAAGAFFSVAGLVIGFVFLRARVPGTGAASAGASGSRDVVKWGVFAALFVMFAAPIVQEPILAWDARSIWFFHGKIIYFNGALDRAGFTPAAVCFSHPDYPKLVPVLSAQLARFAGSWDDFLPKASLLALLLPALLALFSFWERARLSFLFLAGLFLFGVQGELLWNGLMDGYLALYAGLALLFLGRWFERGERGDAWCAAAFLGVVLNLKNEGMVYVVVAASVFFVLVWMRDRSLHRLRLLFADRRFWLQVGLPAACFLVWTFKKRSWGLVNDLDLGVRSLGRIGAHVQAGALGTVAQALLVDALLWKALLLFFAVAGTARLARVRVPFQVWIFLAVSFCYFLAVFAVYLATPADLAWHLETSAARTVLPVMSGLVAAVYVILGVIEAPPRTQEGEGDLE
ncbi:hypothetical protein KP004_07870 [Geomonas oryzisoli]|uniref:Glycosyltransferase RgtA/B/C/D-like domain-containing protein n=1 Tax=Geomonas oryzisoli TaxID=2847992 RepID=A0ABX8JBY4_9BACT|nr:hypothetical protein [Geomonas oryzisoli]QWV95084.1 hypothetical protein KP004_07870 [Geomonas oryzisoli]